MSKILNEQDLIAKGHTHIILGTLRYDAFSNKNKVTIRTRGIDGEFDGNTREIATSDLHQTFWTRETKALIDAAKRQIGRRPTSRAFSKVRKASKPKVNADLEVFVVMDEAEYEALQSA